MGMHSENSMAIVMFLKKCCSSSKNHLGKWEHFSQIPLNSIALFPNGKDVPLIIFAPENASNHHRFL